MAENRQSVLIVHNYYQIPGGEDTVVANEKKLLEDHGHKVVLYNRNNAELKEMSWIQKLCLPITTIFNPRTYWEIKKLIRTEKIDIVHVHNTLNLVSPSVYYAGLAMKVPVVQTVHNFRLICPSATFYRDGHICEDCVTHGLKCAVKHSCYRSSKLQTLACVVSTKIHRMTGIYSKINYICLTEFNKKKLLECKKILEENVFVKPNFVCSDSEFVPENKRINQFVFAARLDRLKGIDKLLEAWNKMGNAAPKLLVFGSGPEEHWCKEFVASNNVNVELRGHVPNIEIRKTLSISKGLVLPTQWYEGFPMTIVESFSVGTPVICSNLGNAGDIVQEGVSGCKFKWDSVDDICLAVERLGSYDDIYRTTFNEFTSKYSELLNYENLTQIYQTTSIKNYNEL